MNEPLVIDIQATPNPNAAKFTLNRVVAAQGTTYRVPAAAPVCRPGDGTGRPQQAGAPSGAQPEWAKRLLGIPGVTQVFALNTFITVSKTPDGDWSAIAPQVEQVLHEAFAAR